MDQVKPQELHRVIQYVTGQTSYSLEDISLILETTFRELSSLAKTTSATFQRRHILEYLTLWTIQQTGFPEPMVREILECAGRWLDEMCQTVENHQQEFSDQADN